MLAGAGVRLLVPQASAVIVRMHACWWGVESIICNMFKNDLLAVNRHWNMHGNVPIRVPMPIYGYKVVGPSALAL